MDANTYYMSVVFGRAVQYFVPIFQRPYVWKEEKQWKYFWETLRNLAKQVLRERVETGHVTVKPHFLGAIVLDQYPVPIGKPDSRSIVDGQQRLMTIQLFLKALRDSLPEVPELQQMRGRVDDLLFNRYVQTPEDRLKVRPTNEDGPVFAAVMDCSSPHSLMLLAEQRGVSVNSQIAKAYSYFHACIGSWIKTDDPLEQWVPRAQALVDAADQKVRLVVIGMDADAEAQVIFETLNTLGTPLLEADLVKDYLFRQAKQEDQDIEKLYKAHWQPFETDHQFWRGEITQGRLKRAAIELFLHHYRTLLTNNDVPAERLFDTFKNWDITHPGTSAETHLTQLARYARHFKLFFQSPAGSPEACFFRRLEILETTTIFPFLLMLFEATDTSPQKKEIRLRVMQMVESFLVRRTICRLTTKNYNRHFLDLVQAVKDCPADAFAVKVEQFLLSQMAESERWPDNKEFLNKWLNVPLYTNLNRARARMILRALEDALPDRFSEGVYIRENLTIEHVLPVAWEETWPLPVWD